MKLYRSLGFLFFALVFNAATAADMTDPVKFVQERAQAVLSALDGQRDQVREDAKVAQEIVREELLPYIDVDYVSRLVLGPHWRSASEQQRAQFRDAFQNFLLNSYAQGLAEFTEDRLKVMPLRGKPNERRTIVETFVTRENGQAVPVAYTLHWTESGWKMYDVIIEGISYVRNYRTDFNSEVEREGLDALIARLERNGTTGTPEAPVGDATGDEEQ